MYTSEKTAVAKPRVLSLYHLVAELLDSYGRVNKERRSCFVNEVPATMVVNSQLIAPILGDLFAIISAHPGRNQVYIAAKTEGNFVKLYAKGHNLPLHCFPGLIAA